MTREDTLKFEVGDTVRVSNDENTVTHHGIPHGTVLKIDEIESYGAFATFRNPPLMPPGFDKWAPAQTIRFCDLEHAGKSAVNWRM